MKDYLLDLIQHTHGLGVIELVKIEVLIQKLRFLLMQKIRLLSLLGHLRLRLMALRARSVCLT